MVQQPRQENPLYSCVVPISDVTGHQDEEIVAFGVSADEAKWKVEVMLTNNYGCSEDAVQELIQQARVDLLSPWCAPSDQ